MERDMGFNPVQKKSLVEAVIEEMISLIERGVYKPGDRLPTEWELCDKLGVSRTVLREALRTLHQLKVIEIRVGDGTYVRTGNPRKVLERKVQEFLPSLEDIGNLLEVRKILELKIIELAVDRAGEEDIQELEKIVEKMKKLKEMGKSFSREDAEFHICLARSTHNPFLVSLMETINPFILEWIYRRERLISPEEVIRLHEYVLLSLKSRDKQKSIQAMKKHLQHSEEIFRKMQENI